MTYNHYIRLDSASRVILGYTDPCGPAQPGDILIATNPRAAFEIMDKCPNRALSLSSDSGPVWLYKYEAGEVRYRSKEEISADLPPRTPSPDLAERLAAAEQEIETLRMALAAILAANKEEDQK